MTPIEWKYGEAFTDGDIVRFYVGTKAYGDLWATVDVLDWANISNARWRATKRNKIFYVRDGRHVLLHRVLTSHEWPVVDHRDGNGLNNCRSNLRRCETIAENNEHGAVRRRGGVEKPDWELQKWLLLKRTQKAGIGTSGQ